MVYKLRIDVMDIYKKQILSYINQICCIMLCIWMCWPLYNVKARSLTVIVVFIWFSTTDLNWLIKRWSRDLVSIVAFLATFIPYLITGTLYYGEISAILLKVSLFFLGMVINHYYMYYKKDFIAVGRMAFVCLIMYGIGSIQTIMGLKQFPVAARLLATSYSERSLFESIGIGGFGFVYSAVFISISLLYFVIKKSDLNRLYRLFTGFILVLLIMMIIKASYAIALILTITGFVLVNILKDKRIFFFFMIICVVLILLTPRVFVGNMILQVANLFKENVIAEKLTDFASVFLQQEMGGQTKYRIHLYLTSLKTFLKNPYFGICGPFGNPKGKIGWHSGWFDMMALYGLFTTIPMFIGIIVNFKKNYCFYLKHSYSRFILSCQIMFVIFGFINPIIYVYQIGFALFFIIPSLPYAFKRR